MNRRQRSSSQSFSPIPAPERPSRKVEALLDPPTTPAKRQEYSQVVSSGIKPDMRRRNSVSLPGSEYNPMMRMHQKAPQQQGVQQPDYHYHITHPDNFLGIVEHGGLMPRGFLPSEPSGLDKQTGRDKVPNTVLKRFEHFKTQQREMLKEKPFGLDFPQELRQPHMKSELEALHTDLKEGTNQENLYMGRNEHSPKTYMDGFTESGAVLFRTRANPDPDVNGFIKDSQGRKNDMRSRGLIIPSSHLEYANVSPEMARTLMDKEQSKFEELDWQAMPQPTPPDPQTDRMITDFMLKLPLPKIPKKFKKL
ncbi:hypothetical protein [Chitinimonas koreensis]|uniref:hypothetical protein n=1 Tax=Chitinimonas koreensis TaxID=356302 RepID=UPI000423F04F|nr:hypothetical protein [Chitinimonas koreensis]QNM96377.1 hypothetical protein H9L41_21745 [Chitinimonas koreensis]